MVTWYLGTAQCKGDKARQDRLVIQKTLKETASKRKIDSGESKPSNIEAEVFHKGSNNKVFEANEVKQRQEVFR